MVNTLKEANLQLICPLGTGGFQSIIFMAGQSTRFSDLLSQVEPFLDGVRRQPRQDSAFNFLGICLFLMPEANLSKGRGFKLKTMIPLHSFLLRDFGGATRVLDHLSKQASYLFSPGTQGKLGDVTIVFRIKSSLTTEIIRSMYPKAFSALRVYREDEKRFTHADVEKNLRFPGCNEPITLSKSSTIVQDRLWFQGRPTQAPFRIHLQLYNGVNSGSGHMIKDKFHLKMLQGAKEYFVVDRVLKTVDDMNPHRIKTLTYKLLWIYERAKLNSSNKMVSSSTKGSLLLPILHDIFSEEVLFEDDQLETDSDDDEEERNGGNEKSDVQPQKVSGIGGRNEGGGSGTTDKSHFAFSVKGDQAGFTFLIHSPPKSRGQNLTYITFRPDSMVIFHGIPVLFVEVDSNNDSADHFRMIGQASGVNRLLNLYGLTADGTNEVITFAIYLDKSMKVTVHILSSRCFPPTTEADLAKDIVVHDEQIEFDLCPQWEPMHEGTSNKVKRIPSEAVKLAKFLHDIRNFMISIFPEDKRRLFSEVIQVAQDFSTLVRECGDTTSASKATSLARKSNHSKGAHLLRGSKSLSERWEAMETHTEVQEDITV
ncbi:hypothetical protein L218DRAFT_1076391 [Marasmius fiardii PR-910]|nr:hypothetical protein L218DRAFT_1076391 [Marasmius fiardii PR-910]